jgi:hypothetical protein
MWARMPNSPDSTWLAIWSWSSLLKYVVVVVVVVVVAVDWGDIPRRSV